MEYSFVRYNLSKLVFGLSLLLTSSLATATPVSLQLTQDTPLNGIAVFSGVLDKDLFPKENLIVKWQTYEVIGNYWSVLFAIFWDKNNEVYTMGNIIAQHLVGPHAGEASPGLKWELVGAGGLFNTTGAYFNSRAASQIHPGSSNHRDLLSLHVDDLNGNAPGFMDSFNQFSATIRLNHVPEPSVLWLLLTGLFLTRVIRYH